MTAARILTPTIEQRPFGEVPNGWLYKLDHNAPWRRMTSDERILWRHDVTVECYPSGLGHPSPPPSFA